MFESEAHDLPAEAHPVRMPEGGAVLLAALEAAHAALDEATVRDELGRQVGWVPVEGLSHEGHARLVELQARLEGRVAGLRLHTVAAADVAGVAESTGATDTPAWAASAAGRNRSRSWGGVWLARLLESTYSHTRAALARGLITEEHASIIVRAAESVPAGVTAQELSDCEAQLVEKAQSMAPKNLRRAARRLLDPISKRLADQHQGELLEAQERRAEAETWLTLSDNGDGTWGGRFTIPELHGQILRKRLEMMSSPRRRGRNKAGRPVEDETMYQEQLSWSEALGSAFLELIEHLPSEGHGHSGITLVVHIDEEKLREGYGAATLDTDGDISHGEARRLACNAGHLPFVLSGRSVMLDLGSSTRLFSKAQAIALSSTYSTCAAEGCERPFAWSELHHLVPWSQGGPTDLANAVPLCGWHHRRIHDAKYDHERLPDGSIRFRHRWRSRWKAGRDPWGSEAA